MKTTLATTFITLAFALAGSGLQATDPPPTLTLTEKFNSTELDPAMWSLSEKGKGRLAVKSGKLNFLVGANPGYNNLGGAELICQYPGFTEAWDLTIALSNTSGPAKKTGCGVMICHAEDRTDYLFLNFHGLAGFTGGVYVNGRLNEGGITRKTPWTKGRIRIQYANQMMKFSISPTGEPDSWIKIGTFSPTARNAGVPALLHANWRMKPTDTFGIQLCGFANSKSVSAGKITMDNFELKVTN